MTVARRSLVSVAALLLAALPVHPATLTVCSSGCDHTTIQAAVDAASPGDTLELAGETFVENVSIAKDLIVNGSGPLATIVDGAAAGSVFTIDNVRVTLRGLTVFNGLALEGGGVSVVGASADVRLVDTHVRDNTAADSGGGINNPAGTVLIARSLISDNSLPGMDTTGGGVFNGGTLTVRESTIRNNSAGLGGAINTEADVVVEHSTLHGNSAEFGGAISTAGGNLALHGCTVSGNSADEGGGFCIAMADPAESVVITQTTITDNTANDGGGIFDYGQIGTIELEGTIVSANPGGNCDPPTGVFTSRGHNVENTDTCGLSQSTDQVDTDPLLGPLAANGGPTLTHAIPAGSPAIDAGPEQCGPVDQRGEARPFDGDGDGSILCDAGAFERSCSGAYRPDRSYGRLLFVPRCTADGSTLPGSPGQPHVYETMQLGFHRGPRDRVFVAAAPAGEFARLVADDELRVDGQPSGLGPHGDQPGTPPYTLGVPIQNNRVPEPSQELDTTLVPLGDSTLTFELVDTDRQVYGNMAIYLAIDCGITLDPGPPTRIFFHARDDAEAGVPPVFDVISGFLGDLRASGDFSLATCLANDVDGEARDQFEDPPAGQARYYVARGVSSCLAQGYGDASDSLSPDPRDALDSASPCP